MLIGWPISAGALNKGENKATGVQSPRSLHRTVAGAAGGDVEAMWRATVCAGGDVEATWRAAAHCRPPIELSQLHDRSAAHHSTPHSSTPTRWSPSQETYGVRVSAVELTNNQTSKGMNKLDVGSGEAQTATEGFIN